MPVMLGARWDYAVQDQRILAARQRGLIDYIEVNYPIAYAADPCRLGIPVFAHTSSNPTCSVHGVNPAAAKFVKEGADRSDSPWVGEHLTWLGAGETGSLGYQINPLFTPDFRELAADNIRRLRDYYGREVALELSPVYVGASAYESEMHFLADIALAADARIILDVTHWQITNRNLDRPEWYGFDALPAERVIELHVAGMRQGSDGYWHDAHRFPPEDKVVDLAGKLAHELPALRAVTFEHEAEAPETDFFASLERIDAVVRDLRPAS